MGKPSIDLSGQNILVTGGGGIGVGAGVCKVLSQCGATVLLNEPDIKDAEHASERYPDAIPVAADVSRQEEVMQMFEDIRQKVGTIHGLVNNAGVGLSKRAHEATEEEFNRLYDTDLKGVWHVSKAFANQLIPFNKSGNIVNISSVHARSTIAKYAIYASAKSAVEGFTRGMAVEWGPCNIRVNAVGPGYVHAEQNYNLIKTWSDNPRQWVKNYIKDYQALSFEIKPEDCGNTVAFLLSSLSRGITGQTVYVDNGTTCLMSNYSFTQKK